MKQYKKTNMFSIETRVYRVFWHFVNVVERPLEIQRKKKKTR